MIWYGIDFDCPECGERHGLAGQAQIPNGPDRAGLLAELYPDGEVPEILGWVFESAIWCDVAGDYVAITDPARVFVWPR